MLDRKTRFERNETANFSSLLFLCFLSALLFEWMNDYAAKWSIPMTMSPSDWHTKCVRRKRGFTMRHSVRWPRRNQRHIWIAYGRASRNFLLGEFWKRLFHRAWHPLNLFFFCCGWIFIFKCPAAAELCTRSHICTFIEIQIIFVHRISDTHSNNHHKTEANRNRRNNESLSSCKRTGICISLQIQCP